MLRIENSARNPIPIAIIGGTSAAWSPWTRGVPSQRCEGSTTRKPVLLQNT
jgi:hypothetical protein